MKFIFFVGRFSVITILLPVLFLTFNSCKNKKQIDIESEILSLKVTGDSIFNDFSKVKKRTEYLAEYTEELYKMGFVDKPEVIEQSDYGFVYKPFDDGGSAIFVSSLTTFDEEIRRVVRITQPLDSLFRDVIDSLGGLVKQVRYGDYHAFRRIYPFIDVQAQFAPDLDIRTFKFYYEADANHNPEKKSILISDPFIDPAGRGWMLTSIAPVYYNNMFQGVIGLDITVDAIKEKYIKNNSSDIMILDSSGVCIAIDEDKAGIFNIPVKQTHKYVQSISNDENIIDDLNLLKSKDKLKRNAFDSLIRRKAKSCELYLEKESYLLISYMIPEMNWFIIKFEKTLK